LEARRALSVLELAHAFERGDAFQTESLSLSLNAREPGRGRGEARVRARALQPHPPGRPEAPRSGRGDVRARGVDVAVRVFGASDA
jgi:hypothetical protein